MKEEMSQKLDMESCSLDDTNYYNKSDVEKITQTNKIVFNLKVWVYKTLMKHFNDRINISSHGNKESYSFKTMSMHITAATINFLATLPSGTLLEISRA